MSLGRYNLTRFNLTDTPAPQYNPTYSMFVTCTASFDSGVVFVPSYFYSQEMQAVMPIVWGQIIDLDFSQMLTAVANADKIFSPRFTMLQQFMSNIYASLTVFPRYDMATALNAATEIGAGIYPSFTALASLTATVNAQIVLYPAFTAYQPLLSSFSIIPTTYTLQDFNITIPPGGKLVIDSDNYTVYLNGESAIDTYSGKWIHIDRTLQGLDVSSNTSGDIAVTILYTERYL